MGYSFLARNKGQGILESMVAMIISILLLGGIINIWVWGNRQIVRRQVNYNNSRLAAGQSVDGYKAVWPVYSPESLSEANVILKNR